MVEEPYGELRSLLLAKSNNVFRLMLVLLYICHSFNMYVAMEQWKIDFEWLRIQHLVKESMQRPVVPDFQTVMFLVGIQELGRLPEEEFTKEEKADLMHVAVCTLLEPDGYYSFAGRDQDGWPHWNSEKAFDTKGVEAQESILKIRLIEYFGKSDEEE